VGAVAVAPGNAPAAAVRRGWPEGLRPDASEEELRAALNAAGRPAPPPPREPGPPPFQSPGAVQMTIDDFLNAIGSGS